MNDTQTCVYPPLITKQPKKKTEKAKSTYINNFMNNSYMHRDRRRFYSKQLMTGHARINYAYERDNRNKITTEILNKYRDIKRVNKIISRTHKRVKKKIKEK